MLVLADHAKQMTLVVMRQRTIWARPEQAIAVTAVRRLNDQAAADHCINTLRLLTQPVGGRAILGLGQCGRLHGKTGAEHLRQDHQIGTARLLQQCLEVLAVGGRIMPGQAGLDQRQFEIGFIAHRSTSFAVIVNALQAGCPALPSHRA